MISVDALQMKKADDLATSKYEIPISEMINSAGRNTATFISALNPKKVLVVYGGGHNGGGGLSAAKYLIQHGINVAIISASENLKQETENQLNELRRMRVSEYEFIGEDNDIILDCLLGYGIDGDPRGKYKELINDINTSESTIVSLDIPSGLNPSTGELYKPHVVADYTLTLGLPKKGLEKESDVVGKLFLVNIGIPNEVYKEIGVEISENLFEKGEIVKLDN